MQGIYKQGELGAWQLRRWDQTDSAHWGAAPLTRDASGAGRDGEVQQIANAECD